ncbi:retrovirus-related Pol polyprotein from transposon 412 [Trichonephila clavipes]|nr:retrovirus-related Pol polyprotein from transposon 412 [Trichonephila clavipes]
MVVDTGANVSIIRKDLAQNLEVSIIWTPPCVSLQTVTGDKIQVHGKANVTLKFGNIDYHHTAYITDITDPCILGLDFLNNNFKLDFENSNMHSKFEDITVFGLQTQFESNQKITAKTKLSLAPRTECIIPDLVVENRRFRFGLIDYPDPYSLKAGVLIASSVIDLSNSVIPVRMANISDKTRTIQEGESCKYCSRIEKKCGVIDPIVRQVTTPSTSALDPWSDESIRKDQLADPEIKPVIEFKESSDEKPSWQNIAPFHPTTKRYWALWDSLHLRNGVLYRKWESDDGKTFRWQLILPKTRISTVLKELHGSPTGGHFGVMKTLQKVRERFYWNNVWSDVEKCCRTCDLCAACKGPRTHALEEDCSV